MKFYVEYMDVTRESSACAVIITQPIETICRMMCKVSLISITELLDRALSKSLFMVDDKNGKTIERRRCCLIYETDPLWSVSCCKNISVK